MGPLAQNLSEWILPQMAGTQTPSVFDQFALTRYFGRPARPNSARATGRQRINASTRTTRGPGSACAAQPRARGRPLTEARRRRCCPFCRAGEIYWTVITGPAVYRLGRLDQEDACHESM